MLERSEHVFVYPADNRNAQKVQSLLASNAWALDTAGMAVEDVAHAYLTQREIFLRDRHARNQPRLFFTDHDWWMATEKLFFVNQHLTAQCSESTADLEDRVMPAMYKWMMPYAVDARGRLLPGLAAKILAAFPNDPPTKTNVAYTPLAIMGEDYVQQYIPKEALKILLMVLPADKRMISQRKECRIGRNVLLERVRHYRLHGGAEDFRFIGRKSRIASADDFIEYGVTLGMWRHTHRSFLQIPYIYASGIVSLKLKLTADAMRAKFG